MKPEKTMICLDRSILEKITNDLRELTDEASQLLRYYHLVVVASTDESEHPPYVQLDNALFLLNLFLREWDRERIEQFTEDLDKAHQKFREILR
ncbi:hypothetical protein PL8927_750070 [Planktothrix serta PCC 8927]|uniref:Uncharacterized protein n=1 Tax=Planktothrix serta PCC 8927 TaxID=671068 RepID=A0A7Z9E4B1_9CYAN|nr:hypothetical protein [Planktothrix serta]VXD22386.1 hypothetical protein PL8927_750070 [Planktothrix serta PCC 8927]